MNANDGPSSAAQDSTSLSLILRVKSGDQDAWKLFSAIYSPLVYGWARRAGLQTEDASDVGQEVFRSVVTAIADFQRSGTGGLRAWLWTITRNKIHDDFRSRKAHPNAAGGTDAQIQLQQLSESPPENVTGEKSLELGRICRRTLELVKAEFEEKTWTVFWRVAVEGDSAADIAADLGVTKWAVYKAKTRIIRRLRQELGDLVD